MTTGIFVAQTSHPESVIIVAAKTKTVSPRLYQALCARFEGIPIEELPHLDFKALSRTDRVTVRTGEYTPYANVILQAGVV